MPQKLAAYPGVQPGGGFRRWGADPAAELEPFLGGLIYPYQTMQLCLEGNFYPVAEMLGLKIPDRVEEGSVEVAPGFRMSYYWGSIDGRSTDYLRLNGPFDEAQLRSLVRRIATVTTVERRRDLDIVLRG